jgi:chaperonin GroEL
LITDKKISSAQEILGLLQHAATTGSQLVLIADDIDGDALSTLVMNKLRGTLKVVSLKAPSFGDRRKAILEDLAILTGAEFVSEERGFSLKEATPEWLGRANQVIATKEQTTVVGGRGTKEAIAARVRAIDSAIHLASSQYEKDQLQQRRAKLQGGVAVISVGAPTETEMKKKKQLFEDSLNATRAALAQGIVPGGGMTLVRAARTIQKSPDPEEATGASILLKACDAPFKQIVSNGGFDGSLYLEEILQRGGSFGFNVISEKIEDLPLAGVMDPAKIVKTGLTIAVSAAGVALLTEVLVAEEMV